MCPKFAGSFIAVNSWNHDDNGYSCRSLGTSKLSVSLLVMIEHACSPERGVVL